MTFKGPFQYKPFYDPMKIREFNIFFHFKNLHIFHKQRKEIIDQYFDYTDAKQQHSQYEGCILKWNKMKPFHKSAVALLITRCISVN